MKLKIMKMLKSSIIAEEMENQLNNKLDNLFETKEGSSGTHVAHRSVQRSEDRANLVALYNKKVFANGSFIKIDYSKKKFFKIIKKTRIDLSKVKFILVRQDPPFNLEYISTTYILDTIKNKVRVINNPTSIRNISEKLYSMKFINFMPDTIFTKNHPS